MKLKKRTIISWCICFPLIIVLIVALIIGNNVLYKLEDTITPYLCPAIVNEQATNAARAEGEALSKNIVIESSVLVKNDNDVLPLSVEEDNAVNVFGWSSIDWVFGGSGSGQVFDEKTDNLNDTAGILEALDEYGIQTNTSLTQMYRNYHKRIGDPQSIYVFQSAFYRLCQPAMSDYPANVLTEAKSFSDTAIVVISRRAGETEDPTRRQFKVNKNDSLSTDDSRTYLEISTEEEEMLTYVGANFDKVIVLINSTNVMELGFMDTIPGLDACLVVGATGLKGAMGIPALLYGVAIETDDAGQEEGIEISPSGKFVDTYAYDFESNVNYLYSGDAGVGHYVGADNLYPVNESRNAGEQYTTATYVDYIEGIYVGYKWYETADKMGVWKDKSRKIGNNVTLSGYDAVVQYPFGFGMSYTKFDWAVTDFIISTPDEKGELVSVNYSERVKFTQDSTITIKVKVTNVGEYSGRDVVQVYLTAPYYAGGIEKSYVSLVGFAKTANLEPDGNQDLIITLDPYDFASYDCYNANDNDFSGWELEHGDYEIKLMTDSHNIKTLKSATGNDESGVFTLNVASDILLDTDKYTQNEVFNKFTGKDANEGAPIDGSEASVPVSYISRDSFPNPYNMTKPEDRAITEAEKDFNLYNKQKAQDWNNATTDLWGNPIDASNVTWGKSGNLRIAEANGSLTDLGRKLAADYNDPVWQDLLDQVSAEDALALATYGAFGNSAINSIGKPYLRDLDGPSQVKSFNQPAGTTKGTGFPCSATMAQSWNASLVYSFGINYGKEMDALGVSGTYAFGCNLHRSPFAGRNYEYLSEDGFISAVMLTQEVKGLKNVGKYTYLKHLVLGECEHDREAMYTWLTEQSLREIYLKPFQKAIQEGGCVGIMSSYNRIGNVWTGGSESLITGILRNEWGFKGAIVTDYADRPKYMNGDQAVRAGANLSMNAKFEYGTSAEDIRNNPRLGHRFRELVHEVTYMYINSVLTNELYNASDDVDAFYSSTSIQSWVWWKPLLTCIDVTIATGCLIAIWFLLRPLFAAKLGLSKNKAVAVAAISDNNETYLSSPDSGASEQSEPEPESTPEPEPVAEKESSVEELEETSSDGTSKEKLEEPEPEAKKSEKPQAPKKPRAPQIRLTADERAMILAERAKRAQRKADKAETQEKSNAENAVEPPKKSAGKGKSGASKKSTETERKDS